MKISAIVLVSLLGLSCGTSKYWYKFEKSLMVLDDETLELALEEFD
jgi:hypothetical protein